MKIPQLDRLGKPGVAGLGVLLFCLSFYAGNIAPARSDLDRLQSEVAKLGATARSADTGSAGPAAPSRQLPMFAEATASLKELNAIAEQHGLKIDSATYAVSEKDGQRRLEVNLPIKASYTVFRAYLRDVLALPVAPSLDELVLQRQQAGDALIEANVRLSYRFAPAP